MVEYIVEDIDNKIFIVRGWLERDNSLLLYNEFKKFISKLDTDHSGIYTIKIRGRNYTLPRKIFICADKNVTHNFGKGL